MKSYRSFGLALCALFFSVSAAQAASKIEGEYLEARTCDVYTGPCFANGEIGIVGREALMAWRVDKGVWNDVQLDGLGACLVLKGSNTIGFNVSFPISPFPIQSVILVDKNATEEQQKALIDFVKTKAGKLAEDVVRVEEIEISLTNDHVSGKGIFKAGDLAEIETRAMKKTDCVCSNESVFYPPLVKVENMQPAYTLKAGFSGEGLNSTWSTNNSRGAFLATFRN